MVLSLLHSSCGMLQLWLPAFYYKPCFSDKVTSISSVLCGALGGMDKCWMEPLRLDMHFGTAYNHVFLELVLN